MEPCWDALSSATQKLFERLTRLPFISDFYLAGGTGLAIHLGHRFSDDLDFFSDAARAVDSDQRGKLIEILRDDPDLKIMWDKDGTFVAQWRAVGISLFRLNYNALFLPTEQINGINIAQIEEIGAMKLAAILLGGTRKDYIDLFFILKKMPLEKIFEISAHKYPHHKAFPSIAIRAISYFDDAEQEPMPKMILSTKWIEVKKYLERLALNAGRKKLDLEKLWSG